MTITSKKILTADLMTFFELESIAGSLYGANLYFLVEFNDHDVYCFSTEHLRIAYSVKLIKMLQQGVPIGETRLKMTPENMPAAE